MKIPVPVGAPEVVWRKYGKSVVRQDFHYPDGSTKDFYFWGGGRPAIVLAITKDGNVIADRQFRHGVNAVVDEIPGGHRDSDEETVVDAVRRELREEGGVEAGRLIELPWFYLDPPSNGVVVTPFLALDCERVGGQNLDPTEVVEVLELPVREWYARMRQPGGDAKTQVASFLAMPYLEQLGF